MALRKRPEALPETRVAVIDERQVGQLIEKGGSVAAVRKRARSSNFPLRFMQEDMYDRIEALLAKRSPKPSMNFFINEAILDKLNAESQKQAEARERSESWKQDG
jgi:hypothetical protein